MLDRVLEGQQRKTVDFNGKIDSVYTNLNTDTTQITLRSDDSVYTNLNTDTTQITIRSDLYSLK